VKQELLALSLALLPLSAFACDAPGTPNPVQAQSVSASQIGLRITNTAKEGSDHDIWFMVQDQSGNVRRFTQGHVNDGETVTYVVDQLQRKKNYCFEVWARDDSQTGCRSKKPSGWACAETKQ
jgi:hypothetical protein